MDGYLPGIVCHTADDVNARGGGQEFTAEDAEDAESGDENYHRGNGGGGRFTEEERMESRRTRRHIEKHRDRQRRFPLLPTCPVYPSVNALQRSRDAHTGVFDVIQPDAPHLLGGKEARKDG
jgi:hypothetical protein